jgi:hypothetical protein
MSSGGWHGGSGAWHGGGWSGGNWGGGWHGGGFHNHGCWGCFGGFAFGLALGSAWYPWYWDSPYYGWGWPGYSYTVVYADDGYYYDRYQRDYGPPPPPPGDAAPPPSYAAPAAPACGSWSWDAQGQQYHWIPCAAAAPPH